MFLGEDLMTGQREYSDDTARLIDEEVAAHPARAGGPGHATLLDQAPPRPRPGGRGAAREGDDRRLRGRRAGAAGPDARTGPARPHPLRLNRPRPAPPARDPSPNCAENAPPTARWCHTSPGSEIGDEEKNPERPARPGTAAEPNIPKRKKQRMATKRQTRCVRLGRRTATRSTHCRAKRVGASEAKTKRRQKA